MCIKLVVVRLAGDDRQPYEGRLEVYYNGRWRTVCPSGFNYRDALALVACRMLGFEYCIFVFYTLIRLFAVATDSHQLFQ